MNSQPAPKLVRLTDASSILVGTSTNHHTLGPVKILAFAAASTHIPEYVEVEDESSGLTYRVYPDSLGCKIVS